MSRHFLQVNCQPIKSICSYHLVRARGLRTPTCQAFLRMSSCDPLLRPSTRSVFAALLLLLARYFWQLRNKSSRKKKSNRQYHFTRRQTHKVIINTQLLFNLPEETILARKKANRCENVRIKSVYSSSVTISVSWWQNWHVSQDSDVCPFNVKHSSYE